MSVSSYLAPPVDHGIDLDLSRNEGPSNEGLDLRDLSPELVRRYPDTTELRNSLAEIQGVDSAQVVVTAGADDALLRCCLARLGPGRRAISTSPTFDMIRVYCEQLRSGLTQTEWWDGPFPVSEVEELSGSSDVAFIVSPNNPTGSAVTETDLRRVAQAASFVVLDAVYAEFGADDLTSAALDCGNVVVVRSLSKAYGLAGLRVGYTLSSASLADELRPYGNPYPVSGISATLALQRLKQPASVTTDYVEAVRKQREAIQQFFADTGTRFIPSQGNFVLFEVEGPADALEQAAIAGIGLRAFPDRSELDRWIRVTVPSSDDDTNRLLITLRGVLA